MTSDYDPDMKVERFPARLRATYLGCGCFRLRDGATVFVRKAVRPDWLHEGDQYILGWTAVQWGMLFHVIEVVPKHLGIYKGGER